MTVFLVVYDKASYLISTELYNEVTSYIRDNFDPPYERTCCEMSAPLNEIDEAIRCDYTRRRISAQKLRSASYSPSLSEMLSKLDDSFTVTLLKLIDAKGLTDVECYKKANVSKQTWYKIINEKGYKPSKNTVISFAIALELSLEETKHLLATVGFALSKSSIFDIIIEYFILNGIYNIFTINETLFHFDQTCLGV